MISVRLKPPVVRIITPLCRALLKIGITPDLMTMFGTLVVVIGSFTVLAQGKLLAAFFIIGFALLTDVLDGTMARISNKGPSKWGSFLDSTLDRIADAAVYLGLTLYLHNQNDPLFKVAVLSIPITALVPYARAKAESLGIECTGGFAERPERLGLLGLFGIMYIIGIDWALAAGVWLVLLLSVVTVFQRIAIVWRATR